MALPLLSTVSFASNPPVKVTGVPTVSRDGLSSIIYDAKGRLYHAWYPRAFGSDLWYHAICHIQSKDGVHWENPVDVAFDGADYRSGANALLAPLVRQIDGRYCMWMTEYHRGHSWKGWIVEYQSSDGLRWNSYRPVLKHQQPVWSVIPRSLLTVGRQHMLYYVGTEGGPGREVNHVCLGTGMKGDSLANRTKLFQGYFCDVVQTRGEYRFAAFCAEGKDIVCAQSKDGVKWGEPSVLLKDAGAPQYFLDTQTGSSYLYYIDRQQKSLLRRGFLGGITVETETKEGVPAQQPEPQKQAKPTDEASAPRTKASVSPVDARAETEVSLELDPTGSEVRVDGSLVELNEDGVAAVAVVRAGKHVIEVTKDGYAPLKQTIDVPAKGFRGSVRLAPIEQQATVHLKTGRKHRGALVEQKDEAIRIKIGTVTMTVPNEKCERVEMGSVEASGKSSLTSLTAAKLPPGFGKTFMLPDSDEDQYGNPVVERDGNRRDPGTGYPCEIWLKEPRVEFVFVPAGEFTMGSPGNENGRRSEEGPLQSVLISEPFYLCKYEVTQAQYEAVVGNNPSRIKGSRNPVEQISWLAALGWCKKLSGSVGVAIALPSEAQWEYACRAGTRTRFSYGDDPGYKQLGEYAWYGGGSGGKEHPVGLKKPNPWGLYDMHGNVWEHCSSRYQPYPYRADDGRENLTRPDPRVCRGGGYYDVSGMGRLRSAARSCPGPGTVTCPRVGFRACAPADALKRKRAQ